MLDLPNASNIKVPAVRHPVFIVKSNGAHRPVVIKAENRPAKDADKTKALARIQFSGGLMDTIVKPNSHQMRPMTDAQIDAFLSLRDDQFSATPDELNYYKLFKGDPQVKKMFMWFHMPFLADLEDLDACVKDQQKMRALARYLADKPEVLEKLGRLVAADFLIGNTDRFKYDGTVLNPGNVFFQKTGDEFDVVGIDYFDPNSHAPEGSAAMTAFVQLAGSADLQKSLAENIVRDLNQTISTALGAAFDDKHRISDLAAIYIQIGFNKGLESAAQFTRGYAGSKAQFIIARANSALANQAQAPKPPHVVYRRRVRMGARGGATGTNGANGANAAPH